MKNKQFLGIKLNIQYIIKFVNLINNIKFFDGIIISVLKNTSPIQIIYILTSKLLI